MQTAAARPDFFGAAEERCPAEWTSVTHRFSSLELDAQLSASGWTLFYMANSIRTSAFALREGDRLATALTRLVAMAREQGCNCLEIDEISTRYFLWIPYLRVSAHPRHIQQGNVFVPDRGRVSRRM